MNKETLLKKLNSKIDALILKGDTRSDKYKQLCKLHKIIVNGK